MASASFKSSTRESAFIRPSDAGSSSKSGDRRRSRSLSRAPPRGKFVNTARGSNFEEISLDDLADEFFSALELDDRGRAGRRLSDATFLMETESSKRRGRSVSRKPDLERNAGGRRLSDASFFMGTESSIRRGRSVSRKPDLDKNAGGRRLSDARFMTGAESSIRRGRSISRKPDLESNARRRSLSVSRYQCSESESESEFSGSSSSLNKLLNQQRRNGLSIAYHKPSAGSTLRRSESHQDLRCSQESHSIHSALTDYEPLDVHMGNVFKQRKTERPFGEVEDVSFYKAMRKETEFEIKTEFEKAIEKVKPPIRACDDAQSNSSDVVQAIAETRQNYATKLEESERRKQELLAELAAEEQRGQELSKIVKNLLPETKESTPGRHTRVRKRSTDKSRISMHLFEDAEKYFEDFLSSVDDTDISSFDGERSDGGSFTGGQQKPKATRSQTAPSLADTDGLVLPWLEWETSNDVTPILCKIKETSCIHNSMHSASSQGSWSPGNTHEDYSVIFKSELVGEKTRSRASSFFSMDDYAHLQRSEDFLTEVFCQRQRVNSGGLLLCRGTLH